RVEVIVDDDLARLVALRPDVGEASAVDDDDRLVVDGQLAHGGAAHRAAATRRGNLRQVADEQGQSNRSNPERSEGSFITPEAHKRAGAAGAMKDPSLRSGLGHYSLRARNIDVIGISLASCSASSMRS